MPVTTGPRPADQDAASARPAPVRHLVDAVAFRAQDGPIGQTLMSHRGRTIHVAGTLSLDRWNGAERVQLRITDVASPDQTVASGVA